MVEIDGNYLEHHGILGQKWGVRRFQNKDGSLTAAGKKRRVSDMSDDELMKANKRAALENTYKKNNPSEGDKIWKAGESAKQSVNAARNALDSVDKLTKKRVNLGKDPSTMTDKELQQIVNRINLENQYKRLTTVEVSNRTVEKTREALELVGSAVGIAAGAAAVLAYIKGK